MVTLTDIVAIKWPKNHTKEHVKWRTLKRKTTTVEEAAEILGISVGAA